MHPSKKPPGNFLRKHEAKLITFNLDKKNGNQNKTDFKKNGKIVQIFGAKFFNCKNLKNCSLTPEKK